MPATQTKRRGKKTKPQTAGRMDLEAAHRFIEKNYADGITLTKIAAVAGLSDCYFHRVFTALYGMTPKTIIANLQIADAMQRLLKGEKLRDIATAVGFAHHSHFTRRFHQIAGATPLKWLRSQKAA